jgi:hypothetical protein
MIGLCQLTHYLNRKILVKEKQIKRNPTNFSLDKVRNYFGENVAFYFAFLEFYTKALIPPAILGKFFLFSAI